MTAELREALNAVGASPFLPKVIDPVMVELQRRYSPLVTASSFMAHSLLPALPNHKLKC